MIKNKFDLILASSSKVRKEILKDLGLKFKVKVPDFDEEVQKEKIQKLKIEKQALLLAEGKALSISKKYKDALVIGSDQICQIKNEIMSKPKNKSEAINQLKKLNGKIHYQNNGVALYKNGKKLISYISRAKIKMRVLSEKEIKSYVTLDNPVGCAGSYKIEKRGRHLFREINGDIASISGLAIQPLLDYLYHKQLIELV